MAALKVLIVEDSELVSEILTEALESDKKIKVVGVAHNGVEALELVPKLRPDLITMDVWMPVMDGFTTVERIMADQPTPILVITSSNLKSDVQLSLRMLAAGALDVIEKPSLQDEKQWERHRTELVAKVHILAGVKVITHLKGKFKPNTVQYSSAATSAPPPPVVPNLKSQTIADQANEENKTTKSSVVSGGETNSKSSFSDLFRIHAAPAVEPTTFPADPFYQVVAIASSTGGPSALLKILQSLPPNLPAGILIVQHISQGFTQGLVEWLQREITLRVKVAQHGESIQPGTVFIAPDRRNLSVRLTPVPRLSITSEGEDFLRPNADVLLQSIAVAFGDRAIGIVLTGMGNDGARGLKEMALYGAQTIAQDEATSLIYGMPKAAAENGAARQILPLNSIASTIVKLLKQPWQTATA